MIAAPWSSDTNSSHKLSHRSCIEDISSWVRIFERLRNAGGLDILSEMTCFERVRTTSLVLLRDRLATVSQCLGLMAKGNMSRFESGLRGKASLVRDITDGRRGRRRSAQIRQGKGSGTPIEQALELGRYVLGNRTSTRRVVVIEEGTVR